MQPEKEENPQTPLFQGQLPVILNFSICAIFCANAGKFVMKTRSPKPILL